MGLDARDDFMEQGYNLAFGFTKPRKVKQNILAIYQPDTAVKFCFTFCVIQ
uniref:Uncharacterized protein n=1 Tax=Candidatus Kentrum sp. LFY TaxID=2126342 RepID=A0A450V967_9GAMM|nr:MAG: hypothetical protein BECKLFY1418A_GA0070994_11421 [Candidatus Kentron sp. LFY]